MKRAGTAGVEYGKLRTRILMWKDMTRELISILLILQVFLFVVLCVYFTEKTALMISTKYALAKLFIYLNLNPNITLALGQEQLIIPANKFITLPTIKSIWNSQLPKFVLFGFISCSVYGLYPSLVGYFRSKAAKDNETEHIRGAKITTETELYSKMKEKGEVPEVPIGGIKMPDSAVVKHTYVVGRPGAGKTTDLYIKIAYIRDKKERAVIHDPKGDYLRKFYDPDTDIILNPLDQRSKGWTLFNEIKTKMDISAVAASLIPPASGNDVFWNNAARDLFTAILCGLYSQRKITNADIYSACASELNEIERLIKGVSGGEAGLSYIQDQRLGANVKAVLMQFARAFEFMQDGELCISEWVKQDSGSGFIFVTNYSDIKDTLRPILSLAIDLLGKRLLSLSEDRNRRIHFLIDETAQLQRLSTIISLLTIGRSFGAACDLRTQDNGAITKIYGKEIFTSIVNACSNNVIFAINDPDTADFFSRKIGKREVRRRQVSTSVRLGETGDGMTESATEKMEELVLPSQITSLEDFECFVKIVNYDIVKTKIQRIEYPDRHREFVLREEFNLDRIFQIQVEQNQLEKTIVDVIGGSDIVPAAGGRLNSISARDRTSNLKQDQESASLSDMIEDMDNY